MKRMYKMFQLFLVARVQINSSLRMQLHCYCVTGWGPRLEGSEIAPYICQRTGGQAGHGADLLFGCEVSQPRALTRFPSLALSPSFLCHLDTRPGQIQATGWLAARLWFHCYNIGGWHPPHPCPLHCWGRKSLSNILPEEGCKHKDATASHLGQLPMFKTTDPD